MASPINHNPQSELRPGHVDNGCAGGIVVFVELAQGLLWARYGFLGDRDLFSKVCTYYVFHLPLPASIPCFVLLASLHHPMMPYCFPQFCFGKRT